MGVTGEQAWVEAGATDTSLSVLQAMRQDEHAAYMQTLDAQERMHNAQTSAMKSMERLADRTEAMSAMPGAAELPPDEQKRWRALELMAQIVMPSYDEDGHSVVNMVQLTTGAEYLIRYAETGRLERQTETN